MLKNAKKIIGSILLGAILFTGCSTHTPTFKAIDSCEIENETAPTWACGIQPEQLNGMYTASSSYSVEGTNETYARKIATAKARGSLVQLLETLIIDNVKSNETQESFDESVGSSASATIAKTNFILKESKVLAYWKHPENNRVYILVGVEK